MRVRFLQLVRDLLPGSARHVGVLAGSSVVAQAIGVAVTPLLTRIYEPAAFGAFGILIAYASVAGEFASLRVDQLIPGTASEEGRDRLAVAAIALCVPVALFAGLVYAVSLMLSGVSSPSDWLAPAFLFAIVLCTGIAAALRLWIGREGQFNAIGRVTLQQGIVRSVAAPALGVITGSWMGLNTSEVVARAWGLKGFWETAAPRLRARFRRAALIQAMQAAWSRRSFVAIALPSTLLDVVGTALLVPLTAYRFGAEAAGLVFVAHRVLLGPTALISGSVADVLHARLGAASSVGESLEAVLRRTARKVSLIVVPAMVVVGVLAPVISRPFFGDDFAQVGFLISILVFAACLTAIVSPLVRVIAVADQPRLKLVYDVIALVLCLLPFAAVSGSPSMFQAIALYSGGRVVGYLVLYQLLLVASRRHDALASISAA
jgi:O-antigen/teichoic acid export membrane protein